MTISLKHTFTSPKADGTDSTLVQPSNWNAEHTITLGAGKVLGRDSSAAGAMQELPISVDSTGQSMIPPSGTTAQRPGTATAGMLRYNTTLGKIELYNGSVWGSVGGGGATVSDTAPSSPAAGDLWWKSDEGQMYVYYNDGTSSQWVIANAFTNAQAYLPLSGGTLTGTLTVNSALTINSSNFASTTFTGTSVNTSGVYAGLDSAGGFAINVRDAGYQAFSTSNTERFRVGPSGQWGIGGANYGTAGQVLTSGGSGAAPSWASAAGIVVTSKSATTSGTSVLTTGIPSTAKRVVLGVVGISVSGSSHMLVQLGTSGGVQNTGYSCTGLRFNNGGTGWLNYTNGFAAPADVATNLHSGNILLTLVDTATNTWACTVLLGNSTGTQLLISAGAVSLSGALDRINFTTVNGTDTFDAGYYTVTYE